jgi:hypothetical protein
MSHRQTLSNWPMRTLHISPSHRNPVSSMETRLFAQQTVVHTQSLAGDHVPRVFLEDLGIFSYAFGLGFRLGCFVRPCSQQTP